MSLAVSKMTFSSRPLLRATYEVILLHPSRHAIMTIPLAQAQFLCLLFDAAYSTKNASRFDSTKNCNGLQPF